MLARSMYTKEYVRALHERTKNDPALLEKVIYAFGLLEAIKKVGLPFCFKGGTSLMLLLEHPKRLSTDIDIIVLPGTDIDGYIKKAGEVFPFISVEENIRLGRNGIEKRHFKFTYLSPFSKQEVTILLDVLFEDYQYASLIERPIRNELLLCEGEDLRVLIPDVNGILGDKFTAFAPHTTGIPFGIGKELEIIKQLFDCSSLFDEMSDYQEVCATYARIVRSEMGYRGLSLSQEDVLKDTIKSCLCIASRGELYPEQYPNFKKGILRIKNHILNGKFSGEIAGACACRVLYLSVSILIGAKSLSKKEDPKEALEAKIEFARPRSFSYLRVIDPIAYGYAAKASKLLSAEKKTNVY